LAVLRLMTNSIFVDWTAGRSPGLCPLSIRAMETDKSIGPSAANAVTHQPADFCARVARATRQPRCPRSVTNSRRFISTPLVGAEEVPED